MVAVKTMLSLIVVATFVCSVAPQHYPLPAQYYDWHQPYTTVYHEPQIHPQHVQHYPSHQFHKPYSTIHAPQVAPELQQHHVNRMKKKTFSSQKSATSAARAPRHRDTAVVAQRQSRDRGQTMTAGDFEATFTQCSDKKVLVQFWVRDCMACGVSDMTWAQAIRFMRSEVTFQNLLSDALADAPYEAFFWECRPLRRASLDSDVFEFVLIKAPRLQGLRANGKPFSTHIGRLQGQSLVVDFPNLGGDTQLIVPAQAVHESAYSHVGTFFREAPQEQQWAMWRRIAETIEKHVVRTDAPVWLSTEGSGVHWVHARLDPRPKYYHHMEYKSMPPSANLCKS